MTHITLTWYFNAVVQPTSPVIGPSRTYTVLQSELHPPEIHIFNPSPQSEYIWK